jgi:hypothetical protein
MDTTPKDEVVSGRTFFLRTAIVIVLALGGLDMVVRYVLLGKSADYANIGDFPRRRDRLLHTTERKIAVLGNSAVNAGVDPKLLGVSLAAHGAGSFHCEAFPADNAQIPEWYAIPQKYFWSVGGSPDVIIICFFNNQLADCPPVEIGRLAHWFAVREDWGELMAKSVTTANERADFLLSSTWLSYAVRSRLRERVLSAFIHDYKAFDRGLINVERRQAEFRRPARAGGGFSYDLLRGLILRARAHDVRLVFVAFPRRPDRSDSDAVGYQIDATAISVVRDSGMKFLDLRKIDGLTPEMYQDGIHLTPQGKDFFTGILGEKLVSLLND